MRRSLGWLLVSAASGLCSSLAGAETSSEPAPALTPLPAEAAASVASASPERPKPRDPAKWIGSISVGHAHDGRLINGVKMPKGEGWILTVPDHGYGTDETIAALVRSIDRVREVHPGTPRAFIGSISASGGGPLPPHKSHQSGLDVDVHFYLTRRDPRRWYEPANAGNLDRVRTWTLLRTLITETDVEMILIDRAVASLLEEYALDIGEDNRWIEDLFHGTFKRQGRTETRVSAPFIKHVPGHTGHMHIRFVSPAARQRGRATYDRLVEQGHVKLRARELQHVVSRGETLSTLAKRYRVRVGELEARNHLASPMIRSGQKLTIFEQLDLRGAREAVVVPARRLPPGRPSLDELGLAFRQ